MKILIKALGIILLMLSCHPDKSAPKTSPHQLTVSILPQKFFVKRIAENRWKVNVMIPPGHNPATYEPTAAQMKKLTASSIYFRIGYLPFELAWMKNMINLNPKMKVVDTSAGIELIRTQHHHHSTDDHREHESNGVDPHIWLSPKSVKTMADHMYRTLAAADPAYQSLYQKNHQKFLVEIDQLDREIKQTFNNLSGKKFLVYHPAWSYFAREYGLIQIPMESEGKHPSPADLKKLIDIARSEKIRFIIVQKQFDTHSAQVIMNEINGQVIQLDPLAEDWYANLKTIASQLKHILTEEENSKVHENRIR
jgi:zinc transport system substrate-binding protein